MINREGEGFIKEPSDTQFNGDIIEAARMKSIDGKITCADACGIAAQLNATMREIGVTLDFLGIRITKCQLGLFGYAPRKMIAPAAETVAPELEEAIRKALADNYLSCAASWEIAGRLGMPRMNLSSACEALKIKIKPCQLGAF
jgi:hypothetical protein